MKAAKDKKRAKEAKKAGKGPNDGDGKDDDDESDGEEVQMSETNGNLCFLKGNVWPIIRLLNGDSGVVLWDDRVIMALPLDGYLEIWLAEALSLRAPLFD